VPQEVASSRRKGTLSEDVRVAVAGWRLLDIEGLRSHSRLHGNDRIACMGNLSEAALRQVYGKDPCGGDVTMAKVLRAVARSW